MKTIKRIFIILFLLALIGSAAAVFLLLNPAWLFRTSSGHGGEIAMDRNRVNIVLLGFDRSEARDKKYTIYRPDTIMVASVDLKTRDIALVNISRDSYVAIAGAAVHDKINHAYMHGYLRPGEEDPHRAGIETTLQTIEDFLGGVPIHHYIALDMDDVVDIVDAAGGIYYDVEQPVRANLGRGRLLVEEGYQLLDGQKFLHYVRDRGTGGDTGRSLRQQQILLASLGQLKDMGMIKNMGPLYRALQEHIETDLSGLQMVALGLLGLRADSDSIQSYLFPGSIQYAPSGGVNISYIVIDEGRRVELIREIFGVTVAGRPQIALPGPLQREPDLPVVTDPDPGTDPGPEEPDQPAEPGNGEDEPPDEDDPPPGDEPPPAEPPDEPPDPGNGNGQAGDEG